MKQFVKISSCDVTYRDVPHLGYCAIFSAVSGLMVQERAALINELCRLSKHQQKAPIPGKTEMDTPSNHAPVRVSPAMNLLRRQMSDLS